MLARWLSALKRRWWFALLGVMVGAGFGFGYAYWQPARFEARTTYVFKMDDVFKLGRGAMPALELLTRTRDIRNSVVRVAASRRTADEAASEIKAESGNVQVHASMMGNSTVLAISVQGSDPGVAVKMADVVGARTARYVHDAFQMYELVQLDAPLAALMPPHWVIPLVVGALGGAALGMFAVGLSGLRPAAAKEAGEP